MFVCCLVSLVLRFFCVQGGRSRVRDTSLTNHWGVVFSILDQSHVSIKITKTDEIDYDTNILPILGDVRYPRSTSFNVY